MRILKPIARSRIPAHTHGNGDRANTSFYDKIMIRAHIISPDRALPVVCTSGDECTRLISALHARGITTIRRGLIIYALKSKG